MRAYRTPILLFAAFLPLYTPFRSRFLVNWDAVNFALGTHTFDLQHHQPHPPGYIGYVAAGWLLNFVTGDANTSLTILSLVSVAAAPAAFFLLASIFVPRRYALWSSILLGLSPVVWYYSGVALTYSVELALGLFFLWAGYLGRRRSSLRLVMTATVLLVFLGALRPSGALFLMPMWLYMAWPLPWRQRLTVAAVLVAGNMLWLVPLMWLSGGVGAFIRASRDLVRLVVVPTSVFGVRTHGSGLGQNVAFVLVGILVGVNFGLFLIFAGLLVDPRAFSSLLRHRAFFLLWLTPPVATYVFLHTGQLGYVLPILPAFFLLMAVSMEGIAERWFARDRSATTGKARAGGGRLVAAGSMGLLAAGSVALFLLVPPALWGLVPREGDRASARASGEAWSARRLAVALENAGIGANPRQFDLRMSDRYWRDLVGFARRYAATNSAILAVPDGEGSFRHLTYYLPRYRVYGLGWDVRGHFGYLATAFGGTSDYMPRNLTRARAELPLPPTVTILLVPDWKIQRLMRGVEGTKVVLDSGMTVLVIPVPPHASLVVDNDGHHATLRVTGTGAVSQ
jgi:hypothetical protein